MKLKAAASLLTMAVVVSAHALTYTDGIFVDTDWTMETIPIAGTAQIGAQVTSGGNPGEFRMVTTTSDTFTWMAHLRTSFTYDPSVSGAITSLDWNLDRKNIDVIPASQGQGSGYLIKQGGKYYLGSHFISGSSDFMWVSDPQSGLTSAGFLENFFGPNTPDFTASGSAMTFGFYTSNGNAAGTKVGYDNFNLTINAVPEPSICLGLATGIGLLIRRRRS